MVVSAHRAAHRSVHRHGLRLWARSATSQSLLLTLALRVTPAGEPELPAQEGALLPPNAAGAQGPESEHKTPETCVSQEPQTGLSFSV